MATDTSQQIALRDRIAKQVRDAINSISDSLNFSVISFEMQRPSVSRLWNIKYQLSEEIYKQTSRVFD